MGLLCTTVVFRHCEALACSPMCVRKMYRSDLQTATIRNSSLHTIYPIHSQLIRNIHLAASCAAFRVSQAKVVSKAITITITISSQLPSHISSEHYNPSPSTTSTFPRKVSYSTLSLSSLAATGFINPNSTSLSTSLHFFSCSTFLLSSCCFLYSCIASIFPAPPLPV